MKRITNVHLDHCAVNLLDSLLCAGQSRREGAAKPVPVPPASQLALLNNLIIHPAHTTRASATDLLEVSSLALGYLRNLVSLVGPINSNLRTAFLFHGGSGWSRRAAQKTIGDDDISSGADDERDHDRISGLMASEQSLWYRASDFWAVIGWAFNCSAVYPQRWRYWRAWLEFMLEVLEADWADRLRMDEEAHEQKGVEDDQTYNNLKESILIMYLKQRNGRSGGLNAIRKAVLANGSKQLMLSFQEVFEKETKGISQASRKRKREKEFDLENDKFGDYYDDDSISSGGSQPSTPQKGFRSLGENGDRISPGMIESVPLRLRLFKLLSAASAYCHDHFVHLDDLYSSFTGSFCNLELPLFSLYMSHHSSPLLVKSQVTLIRSLLHIILPSSCKDPGKVDPDANAIGGISGPMLEQCYLPYAAGTAAADENAKVSLLLENLMQILWSQDALWYTASLRKAITTGITAREAKTKRRKGGRGRVDGSDKPTLEILHNSSQRLLAIADVLQQKLDKDEISHVPG
jgi:hypothetical protein